MSITLSEAQQYLDFLYENMRAKITPLLLSSPGIGKTSIVYQLAEKKGVNVVPMVLSQCLPSETSGIAMPDTTKHSLDIYNPTKLSSLKDGDILFLDEILQADPLTLKSCLKLILERELMSGDHLPDVFIVAAANPKPASTFEWAIRDRFQVLDIEFEKSSWLDYVNNKYHIVLPNEIALLIATKERNEWNVLTPRTLTNAIELALKCNDKDLAKKYLTQVFDLSIAHSIVCAAYPELTAEQKRYQQWRDKVSEIVSEETNSTLEVSQNDSMETILEKLKSYPQWGTILKRLQEVKLDKEE